MCGRPRPTLHEALLARLPKEPIRKLRDGSRAPQGEVADPANAAGLSLSSALSLRQRSLPVEMPTLRAVAPSNWSACSSRRNPDRLTGSR